MYRPQRTHSSSLGPSLAHVEGRAPCSPHCHCSGGHGRNGRCVAIKVTNNMPVNRRPCRPVNRGVPYHAESALSSAQESSAHAGALLNEHLLSCTAFCSQGSIAEVGSGARRSRFIHTVPSQSESWRPPYLVGVTVAGRTKITLEVLRFISPTSSNPGCAALTRP